MPHSRFAHPSVLLVALSACTASWNALVRYSDEPAPAGEGQVEGVYAAVFEGLVRGGWPSAAILVDSLNPIRPVHSAVMRLGQLDVPGHWVDTLRDEVRPALWAPELQQDGDRALILQGALRVGFQILPPADTLAPARLWLSRPGFNADSTIAALQFEYWCGFRCGHGATLLLARRPGYQWRVWDYRTGWRS